MNHLFEEFQGADLERLADCLAAIRKAGLKVDKYTQAGINQSSGNVWVWSENWAGCVACSIGFDVFWVYTCPECGYEYEYDNYSDLENYAETCASPTMDGKCDKCCDHDDTYDDYGVNTKNTFNTQVIE